MEIKYSFNLSRVLKHLEDNTFGIVSAYLGNLSLKENKERQKKLKDKVRSKGYGYKEIKGFWKGEEGILEEEYSLFIPKVTFEDIKSFGKEFDQEAIVYGNPAVDEIIIFNLRKNSIINQFKDILTNPNEAWDAYSKIKNKSFKFSEVDWYMDEPAPRTSYMGALVNNAWCDLTKAWDITEEEDRKITLTKKATNILNIKEAKDDRRLIQAEGPREIYAGGVYRVVQIGNKKPYAVISAFRKTKSPEKNKELGEDLQKEIKALGLHFYNLIGFYKECPEGKPQCSDEEKIAVEEESYFVPYREDALSLEGFIEKFISLCKKFGQDSVMIGLPKAYSYEDKVVVNGKEIKTGKHYLFYSNGNAEEIGTKVTPQKIVDYGSIALDPKKDRKIEWVVTGTQQPLNYMSVVSFKHRNKLWVEGATDLKIVSLNDLLKTKD